MNLFYGIAIVLTIGSLVIAFLVDRFRGRDRKKNTPRRKYLILSLLSWGFLIVAMFAAILGVNRTFRSDDAESLRDMRARTGLNITYLSAPVNKEAELTCLSNGADVKLSLVQMDERVYVKIGSDYILATPAVIEKLHPGFDCSIREK